MAGGGCGAALDRRMIGQPPAFPQCEEDWGVQNRHAEIDTAQNHVLAWGESSAIIFIASRSADIGKLC